MSPHLVATVTRLVHAIMRAFAEHLPDAPDGLVALVIVLAWLILALGVLAVVATVTMISDAGGSNGGLL